MVSNPIDHEVHDGPTRVNYEATTNCIDQFQLYLKAHVPCFTPAPLRHTCILPFICHLVPSKANHVLLVAWWQIMCVAHLERLSDHLWYICLLNPMSRPDQTFCRGLNCDISLSGDKPKQLVTFKLVVLCDPFVPIMMFLGATTHELWLRILKSHVLLFATSFS